LNRQKSISSQGASISACCTVLDWPSMVEAAIVSRQGPESSSAALRKTAARSSKARARHAGAAASAASMASRPSWRVAWALVPRRDPWRCGWTTSKRSPPAIRVTPPMVMGSSMGFSASSLSFCSRRARSGLPGA
jgi:hypothetical protein